MKPSAFRIERLLAKVEAEVVPPPRVCRYAFHPDEVAEAEAQGLPYALVPRQEWLERYATPGAEAEFYFQRWAGRLHSPRSARCSRSAEAIGTRAAAGKE